MKLSANTVEIMKNFYQINEIIELIPGTNVLCSVSPVGNIAAHAEIEETWPVECVLRNYGVIFRLFDEPEFDFKEHYVDIRQDLYYQKFAYSNKILAPKRPDFSKFEAVEEDVSFDVSEEDLWEMMSAAKVIGASTLKFSNKGISAVDKDSPEAVNPVTKAVDGMKDLPEFTCLIDLAQFKIIKGDYNIRVVLPTGKNAQKFAIMKKDEQELTYVMAVFPESKMINS